MHQNIPGMVAWYAVGVRGPKHCRSIMVRSSSFSSSLSFGKASGPAERAASASGLPLHGPPLPLPPAHLPLLCRLSDLRAWARISLPSARQYAMHSKIDPVPTRKTHRDHMHIFPV